MKGKCNIFVIYEIKENTSLDKWILTVGSKGKSNEKEKRNHDKFSYPNIINPTVPLSNPIFQNPNLLNVEWMSVDVFLSW